MSLIDRAPGDDVVVPVRMRRSSFEKLSATADGRSVPITEGMIGLVPDPPVILDESGREWDVWTFVVWSGEPIWRGVPEQIPGNEASVEALRREGDR